MKGKSVKEIMSIADDIYYGDNKELLEEYKDYAIEKKYEWLTEPRYEFAEEVCYWRKANQIHNWFVKNVQNGVDDCEYYEVTKEQLEELKNTCEKVLESLSKSKKHKKKICVGYSSKDGDIIEEIDVYDDVSVAEELLPTTRGFFFGGVEYDEWYAEDLKNTIEEFEKILKEFDSENEYLVYTSSW